MITETKAGGSLNTKACTKPFIDVDLEECIEFFTVEGSYWQILNEHFPYSRLRSQCIRLENGLLQQMLGLHTGPYT